MLLSTTVVLTALEVDALDLYYTVYVIECLVVNQLFFVFSPKTRPGLNIVSIILTIGIVIIIFIKILELLR